MEDLAARKGEAQICAGHVGTGFDHRTLTAGADRLTVLEQSSCPFTRMPPTNERPHWGHPLLGAEVKFLRWTEAGLLRAPVFVGVRNDVTCSYSARVDLTGEAMARESTRWLSEELRTVAVTAIVDERALSARVVVPLTEGSTREAASLFTTLLARITTARWPGVKVRSCTESTASDVHHAADLGPALDSLRRRWTAVPVAEGASRTKRSL